LLSISEALQKTGTVGLIEQINRGGWSQEAQEDQ
jgi:hypothetical protein